MKVIFAGTPEFAVSPLRDLHELHDVVAVFTQPDRKAGRGKKLMPPPVKQFALQHDIPVFQPSSLKDQAQLIKSFQADVMVVVAYGMLLPQEILDIPQLGGLNIHASLLPRWRGAAPIQRAIEAGDHETGVSIMRMELGLDTGPVFKMLTVEISKEETSSSLHTKLADLGAKGICEVLDDLDKDPDISPAVQDDSRSSYAKKLRKDEANINWHRTAEELHRQLRAFIPWPVCQTYHAATRIRIWKAKPSARPHSSKPGTILSATNDGIEVACVEGTLTLEVLQRDGSRQLPYSEFKNGYDIEVGEQLGQSG